MFPSESLHSNTHGGRKKKVDPLILSAGRVWTVTGVIAVISSDMVNGEQTRIRL